MPDANEFGNLHDDPAICPMWCDWCRCTPQSVLIRALELRELRERSFQAHRAAYDRHWNDGKDSSKAAWDQARADWLARYEDYRAFLVSVGASNLDEIIDRANRAAATAKS